MHLHVLTIRYSNQVKCGHFYLCFLTNTNDLNLQFEKIYQNCQTVPHLRNRQVILNYTNVSRFRFLRNTGTEKDSGVLKKSKFFISIKI